MNLGPTEISSTQDLDELSKNQTPWFENGERCVIIEKYEESCVSIKKDYTWFETREIMFIETVFKNSDGQLHRNNGNPSVITKNNIWWHKNGKPHRNNNKPAVIRNSTNVRFSELYKMPIEEYWKNGEFHRDNDLPAIKFLNENHSLWFFNGKLHRDNNKPSIINGNFYHYHNNGKLYKSEINYDNKYVNWIMKNPYKIVGTFLTILLLLFL